VNEQRETTGTQAIDRALDVLEMLGNRPDGCTAVEVADATGLSRPTVHRMLGAFTRRGYVRQGPGIGQYRLGFHLVELASGTLAALQLRQEAHPYLRRLSEAAGETVHLTVLEDGHIVYIDKMESDAANIRMASRIGGRMPVHCTASGKAILSLLPEAEVRRILAQGGMPRRTPQTITDPETFVQHLRHVRQDGLAYDRIENEEGIICLAAPVRGHGGGALGAVSVSGLAFHMTEARLAELRELLLQCVVRISATMGWSGGSRHEA
jgi:IclR family transcriptional regulator, KDG regulon repressor